MIVVDHAMRDSLVAGAQLFQEFLGWTCDDARRLATVGVEWEGGQVAGLVTDFVAELVRRNRAGLRSIFCSQPPEGWQTGLSDWVRELFGGNYGAEYVERRWGFGQRLAQVFRDSVGAYAALARLGREVKALAESRSRGRPAAEWELLRGAVEIRTTIDLWIMGEAFRSASLRRVTVGKEWGNLQAAGGGSESQKTCQQALRAVLEVVPCMIVVLDRCGIIRYFSPHAETLTSFTADEVVGTDYFSRFIRSPELVEAILKDLERTLDGRRTTGFVNPIFRRDGSQLWMVWNTERIEDDQGEPAVLAVGQDVTALRQAQVRVVQSERLAAIGQMMTGLAHESRNALQRSQACLEMLGQEICGNPTARDLLNRIQLAQDTLHGLYEEVLQYAAPIRLHFCELSLGLAVENAWQQLERERESRDAVLRIDASGVLDWARADAQALGDIFRNILKNSLSACPDPVEIRVATRQTVLDGRPAVFLSIIDNGPGFAPEARARVFDPFFTTKTKGTGLGMAFSRRLVEAHGGVIFLGESASGGAEVIVILPRDGPLETSE